MIPSGKKPVGKFITSSLDDAASALTIAKEATIPERRITPVSNVDAYCKEDTVTWWTYSAGGGTVTESVKSYSRVYFCVEVCNARLGVLESSGIDMPVKHGRTAVRTMQS